MITTPQGFDLQGQEPLEGKTVQLNAASRVAITTATKYDGLTVYQVDTRKTWQFQGTPAAGSWIELVFNGFPTTIFISTSAGATDAGKPIILDATGKIDASMLSASDLSLYYLLDGTRPLTGNMLAGGNKIKGLAIGVVSGDSVAYQQLADYLPIGATAANSAQLSSQPASYYLNANNINAGIIDDSYLPATISSDITGNAATAGACAAWTNPINITLAGDATSPPTPIQGTSNITIYTTINGSSHTHNVSQITGTSDVFDRDFGTTAGTVAEGDHTHSGIENVSVEIGSWDMDTNVSTAVNYTPPSGKKVVGFITFIRPGNSVGTVTDQLLPLDVTNFSTDASAGYSEWKVASTQFDLTRKSGGDFDNTAYSGTGFNRGYVNVFLADV